MCLKEIAPQVAGWRIDIVATDLSTEVLEKAKAGIYSQFEVQRGLPIQMLIKYFMQIGETWQIAPEIRAMVQFRPFNLMNDFAALGMFDVVFCRNVLIYFDQPTKVGVLDRMARTVERDGYLVLGAAETVVGLTDSFKPVPDRRGLYSPNPAPADGRSSARRGRRRSLVPQSSRTLSASRRARLVSRVASSYGDRPTCAWQLGHAPRRGPSHEGRPSHQPRARLRRRHARRRHRRSVDLAGHRRHRRLRGSLADVCAPGAGRLRHLRRLCARERQSGGGVHRCRARPPPT